jgi:tRNA pseudouridine38-40 synthase
VTTDTDEPGTEALGGGLVRVRLDLSYDGTDFSGWARQPGRRTVEETLAAALAQVLRLAAPAALVVAGRTDAGVHATGQVAHADLPETDIATLARRLRGALPSDVVVRRIELAPPGFDARFSATARSYRFRVSDQTPDPLRRRDTLDWSRPLDVEAMQAAAALLVGEHDFAAYCRRREGATTIRHLRCLEVAREDAVIITAVADAFCHNQVRAMVGALLAVGDGRRPVPWPGEVLTAGVRDSAVTVAPAHGLTLVTVDYPPEEHMARRAREARQRRTALSLPASPK